MKHLVENVQGCKFAERHSDEISLLVTDFDTNQTDAYFDYNVQKICSVVASMATAEFCRLLINDSQVRRAQDGLEWKIDKLKLDEPWPTFDARCFNIPMDEVTNYLWWRMLDAKRNSVSMVAQANFSHQSLQGKSSNEMQEMLWQEKQINWAKLPQGQKIGFICIKKQMEKEIPAGPDKGKMAIRNIWGIDTSPGSRNELDGIIKTIRFYKEEESE